METASRTKTRQIAALCLNLAVVVMELIGTTMSAQNHGFGLFQFYTEDSNIFALFACGIMAFFEARSIFGGKPVPAAAKMVKYMSVCCLSVTFIVVITVLSPMYGADGYRMMLFSGSMLYHHFLCPIAAVLSFLLFEPAALSRKDTLAALVPTCVYAAVSITLNILRVMEGPYPFLMVYDQPVWLSCVWCAAILGGAWLIALLLRLLNKKLAK